MYKDFLVHLFERVRPEVGDPGININGSCWYEKDTEDVAPTDYVGPPYQLKDEPLISEDKLKPYYISHWEPECEFPLGRNLIPESRETYQNGSGILYLILG
ncbi:predicted protein [Sclerotinia sclerotiorum 1980 UF-70]|uniref:Uncharacterized protein n=1 Tax=Sclerotinia sclerotiorum (strain ATCC 18683 / 1980 / Ss-1) TaxID=665079 RepID=A7ED77_SCLS1|nr:predicted protein [Sclerotinia sclerotiorum 1980 UF-70]EDO00793.1 predicted protein [Sclerotinia sclerotiorum 1980 UF-70]